MPALAPHLLLALEERGKEGGVAGRVHSSMAPLTAPWVAFGAGCSGSFSERFCEKQHEVVKGTTGFMHSLGPPTYPG